MDLGSLIAALLLGFVAGALGRALVPNDVFSQMSGWPSWLASTVLSLLGALVGYWIFVGLFAWGDEAKFDWGGIVGAIVGAVVVVALGSWLIKKVAGDRVACSRRTRSTRRRDPQAPRWCTAHDRRPASLENT